MEVGLRFFIYGVGEGDLPMQKTIQTILVSTTWPMKGHRNSNKAIGQ